MGFKMKQGPISMKGSPVLVDIPDPKDLKVVDLVAKGKADKAARNIQKRTDYANQSDPFKNPGNLSYKDRMAVVAGKRAEKLGKGKSKAFDKYAKVKKPTLTFPEQPKIKIDPVTESNSTVTTKAKPAKKKKEVVKKTSTPSTKRKPIISDEAFEKRAKAQGQKPKDGKTKGKKVNITDAQFNKRAKAQGQKPTDGKAPKVDKVLSKRELRLANVKRKAANEKAKTNKTAKSIDAGKSKSADTGAKQTSARSSRSKAKRLENRATRIQGRIDRKGKSSAEKKASRQEQRKKIKENR